MDLFSKLQDVSAQSDPHHAKCLLNRWALEERRRQQQQLEGELEGLVVGPERRRPGGVKESRRPGWGVNKSNLIHMMNQDTLALAHHEQAFAAVNHNVAMSLDACRISAPSGLRGPRCDDGAALTLRISVIWLYITLRFLVARPPVTSRCPSLLLIRTWHRLRLSAA